MEIIVLVVLWIFVQNSMDKNVELKIELLNVTFNYTLIMVVDLIVG